MLPSSVSVVIVYCICNILYHIMLKAQSGGSTAEPLFSLMSLLNLYECTFKKKIKKKILISKVQYWPEYNCFFFRLFIKKW